MDVAGRRGGQQAGEGHFVEEAVGRGRVSHNGEAEGRGSVGGNLRGTVQVGLRNEVGAGRPHGRDRQGEEGGGQATDLHGGSPYGFCPTQSKAAVAVKPSRAASQTRHRAGATQDHSPARRIGDLPSDRTIHGQRLPIVVLDMYR